MIIIHARIQIDPAKQNQFLQAVQPLVAASRAESGNISYDLLSDTESDHIYTMIEVWQDGQAVASHNASEHFTSFSKEASEFLTAPLDAKAYVGQPATL